MQILQIKPSTPLLIKAPSNLSQSFTLSNLTLHSVCIYIIPIHKNQISVFPKTEIIQAFQELKINVIAHWSQKLSTLFKTKLRVYIWENYDDLINIKDINRAMFNQQTDGNCLLFQQVIINFQLDQHNIKHRMKELSVLLPKYYFARRVRLPNFNQVTITNAMQDKLLDHCQKLGKVKGIYTYQQDFVLQFVHVIELVSSFVQIRDDHDNLAIFVIGCIPEYGKNLICPNTIDLLSNRQKQITKSFIQVHSPTTFQHHHHYHNPSKIAKQSFIQPKSTTNNNTKGRRRNKSQQSIRLPIFQEQQYRQVYDEKFFEKQTTTMVDIDWIKDNRGAQTFQIKAKKSYKQSAMQITKKVLNAIVVEKQNKIYLLLNDAILVCDINNIADKWTIKFEPIDKQNINLPTPMLALKDQVIFGNQSYLYWVSLQGNSSTWKYVQRKQIYCLQVIQELNLLLVGGKNFSKLSYLGKSTHRSNIKVYSGGKTGKHDHLFTYDLPKCSDGNVIELQYITTKPNGTKILILVTHLGRIVFLRVRAYNQFEVYSQLDSQQIGIQQLFSLKYIIQSGIVICFEKLDENNYCFKTLKVNCAYEKVEFSTQSLKLPPGDYIQTSFKVGYENLDYNDGWVSVMKKDGTVLMLWLSAKKPEVVEVNPNVRGCFIVKNGYILQQKTSIRYKILKQ